VVPGAQSHRGVTLEGAWRTVARAWERIPLREPWRVLLPLLAFHWIALVVFAASVHHNGWLFYQGGDQIWYWTTGWFLGRAEITEPIISHGWSMLLVPGTWIGGPGFLGGLPWALLLQVLVLAPLVLWLVYELGARVGGRWIGYLAATLWTVGPYLAIPLFVHRYHDRYVDQYLPHPLGLTAMGDYAAVAAILASAVVALRAVQANDLRAVALSGLLAGFAGVVKPSSLLFVPAAVLFLALARHWRKLVVWGAAIVPGVLALLLWKYRGFGYVPAFQAQDAQTLALGVDSLREPYDRYLAIDWHHLDLNLLGLGEVFWSLRVLQWLPFAGAIAVASRSLPAAALLTAWFWIFFLFKGSAETASVDSGSFFRLVMPVVPVLVVFGAALLLLVPRWGAELARRSAPPPPGRLGTRALVVAVVLLGVVPLAWAGVVQPLRGPGKVVQIDDIGVPVDAGLGFRAQVAGDEVRLLWKRPPTAGSGVFYKLFRTQATTDTYCEARGTGADECELLPAPGHATRARAAVDRPPRGTWTYRVGVGANWLDDPARGDIFLVSPPVTVTVP
jgi:hypothetical protein